MEEQGRVFETLADPRAGNAGKHSLNDILVIALCTVLCGGEHLYRHGHLGTSQAGVSGIPLTAETRT